MELLVGRRVRGRLTRNKKKITYDAVIDHISEDSEADESTIAPSNPLPTHTHTVSHQSESDSSSDDSDSALTPPPPVKDQRVRALSAPVAPSIKQ